MMGIRLESKTFTSEYHLESVFVNNYIGPFDI